MYPWADPHTQKGVHGAAARCGDGRTKHNGRGPGPRNYTGQRSRAFAPRKTGSEIALVPPGCNRQAARPSAWTEEEPMDKHHHAHTHATATSATVKDPVCGMD